jgi:WD40 repeat protein
VRGAWISPDGRFVATGSHGGAGGVKIWETEHGQVVKELPVGMLAGATFSPDGRWLAVHGSEGGRILTAGTWEEGPAIPSGQMAFSRTGPSWPWRRDRVRSSCWNRPPAANRPSDDGRVTSCNTWCIRAVVLTTRAVSAVELPRKE